MQIVRHYVDEVQMLGYLANFVGQRGGRLGSSHSGGEEESVLIEFGSEHLEQDREVPYVFRFAATLVGVLPVEVETVEIVFFTELYDVLDEVPGGCRVGGYFGVSGGSLVPSTDGDKCLGVALLVESIESAESVLTPVVGKILPRVQDSHLASAADADEGVDGMGTKFRLDVTNIEFAVARPVNGPATEVANDLGCAIGGKNTVLIPYASYRGENSNRLTLTLTDSSRSPGSYCCENEYPTQHLQIDRLARMNSRS